MLTVLRLFHLAAQLPTSAQSERENISEITSWLRAVSLYLSLGKYTCSGIVPALFNVCVCICINFLWNMWYDVFLLTCSLPPVLLLQAVSSLSLWEWEWFLLFCFVFLWQRSGKLTNVSAACFSSVHRRMVFEELWGLWTTMTISPPVWWRGVHIVKIPWINYCAHSFSYLVMSAVMTSVSGIWDGYFFNVNFPEIFLCLQAVVFFCKLCDQINLTLWRLAGHLTRLRRTSSRISPDWRRQRGSFFIPDGAFDELCTVKTCD